MSDAALAAAWALLLCTAVGAVLALRRSIPGTYLRDCLHVGAVLWPLGFALWRGRAAPMALATAVAAATFAVPLFAARVPLFARLRDTVASGDERYQGLLLYALSFCALTWVALLHRAAPAAAGLCALALGDGIGGLVGRRYGHLRYSIPGAKPKSVEGSVAVALFGGLGAWLGAAANGAHLPLHLVAAAGVVAAIAEALSPRGTDNVTVPAAVWALLALAT